MSEKYLASRKSAISAGSKFTCIPADFISRTCIRQHTSAYVSIRQHTSAYVEVHMYPCRLYLPHLHTSAYVSIRQHTSAYDSIRQHTSAYVSIRMKEADFISCTCTHFLRGQYLYFCTSKASKLSTSSGCLSFSTNLRSVFVLLY
jgi:hypothetical protein